MKKPLGIIQFAPLVVMEQLDGKQPMICWDESNQTFYIQEFCGDAILKRDGQWNPGICGLLWSQIYFESRRDAFQFIL
jgi:hypothetical protein